MDSRIETILKLIKDQSNTRYISAREAGALLGLSKEYFLRLFHDQMQIGFRQYLREVKMLRAVKLMQERDRPIKEIAHQLGYTDISNFYRDFKDIYRTNPRQFRDTYVSISPQQAHVQLLRLRSRSTIVSGNPKVN